VEARAWISGNDKASLGHTISVPDGIEAEFGPSLIDPGAGCDEARRGRDVVVRVEETSLSDRKQAHVRSTQLPIDTSVDVYPAQSWTKGEECKQERNRRGDVFTLRCGYVDQPHSLEPGTSQIGAVGRPLSGEVRGSRLRRVRCAGARGAPSAWCP